MRLTVAATSYDFGVSMHKCSDALQPSLCLAATLFLFLYLYFFFFFFSGVFALRGLITGVVEVVTGNTRKRTPMSDLHQLCKFSARPVGPKYVEQLLHYLTNGIPATYTVEEAYNYEKGIESDELATTTTPLHLICTHMPLNLSNAETEVVLQMVGLLLEYGAGWSLVDINNDTPGCILIRRGLKQTQVYKQIVNAGVRAELLLRKVEEIEFVEEEDFARDLAANESAGPSAETAPASPQSAQLADKDVYDPLAPSNNQQTYLQTKLEYTDDALVTKDAKDGVMMEWESALMQMGCDSLFKEAQDEQVVLNIGFGMGIIDTMIQARNPTTHYICEAHPDVLAKLRRDGWFDKPNVVVLAGRWQDELSKLLSRGNVFFDGIYYDTYSEHYHDMLDLFDFVVGLLKPLGVFLFFNGLGADRQVVYEVYKELVEIDLGNYGLQCRFIEYKVPAQTMEKGTGTVWDGIKREYWSCPVYYHPEARFMDV